MCFVYMFIYLGDNGQFDNANILQVYFKNK